MNPPPINRWVYSQFFDEGITSWERLSDTTRIVFVILYRLRLVSEDSSMNLLFWRKRLREFGERWYSEDRASRSLYKDISRK